MMKEFTDTNAVLNSYNYAKLANVVFGGTFRKEQLKELSINSYKTLRNMQDEIIVRNSNFFLKENYIIFSSFEFIDQLFHLLKPIKEFQNIKLITHQGDNSVTKRLYNSKPNCISDWYSINVEYEHKNLIPIPIGLSNGHPKNLNENKIIFKTNIKHKKTFLYLNFNENTNFKERESIKNYFKQFDWAKVDNFDLPLNDYSKNINNSRFVLCPWGNGYDTHRFWEVLYSGSIPVTKYHNTYSVAKDLPVIFVDNYEQINLDFLNLKLYEFQKREFNKEILNINYWKNKVNETKLNSDETKTEIFINNYVRFLSFKNFLMRLINSKKKILFFYFRKLKKLKF